MTPWSGKFAEKSILILIAINVLIGFLTFREYGYSWDEPLFYDYAKALGYAYSPREWLSEDFDVTNAFGASGDDHKTRGPAYLLLARGPVQILQTLGLDQAAAWHLINFLCFQFGVYFLYRLALRWVRPYAALAAALLFAWQPLLWGHAFVNPKDMPFLVFFVASVCLGFEMVDRIADEALTARQKFSSVLLPAIVLGLATSVRVLGPLAGLLVLAYAGYRLSTRIPALVRLSVSYVIIAIGAMLVTWPFLWEDPLQRFMEVLSFMSDNPTNLSVLFDGEIYRAGDLPRAYLPTLLATTLTEPVWPLFSIGVVAGYWRMSKQIKAQLVQSEESSPAGDWMALRSALDVTSTRNSIVSLTLVLLWFVLLVLYVLIRKPAMYDGLRHFLFIIPPIFIFAGLAFDFLIEIVGRYWLYAAILVTLLIPGVVGIYRLHPYQYTYYNSFVGGTDGAFRRYETDYWLTCYKDAVEQLNATVHEPSSLYVHREAYIAQYYANERIQVHNLRGSLSEVQSGDYVLVNTRSNEDRRVFQDAPPVLQVGRGDATFCVIKQIP